MLSHHIYLCNRSSDFFDNFLCPHNLIMLLFRGTLIHVDRNIAQSHPIVNCLNRSFFGRLANSFVLSIKFLVHSWLKLFVAKTCRIMIQNFVVFLNVLALDPAIEFDAFCRLGETFLFKVGFLLAFFFVAPSDCCFSLWIEFSSNNLIGLAFKGLRDHSLTLDQLVVTFLRLGRHRHDN